MRELFDAPRTSPSADRKSLTGRVTLWEVCPVDVLRDVFDDVASSATFFRVARFRVKTGFAFLFVVELVAIFTSGDICTNAHEVGFVFCRAINKGMKMRCPVFVGLGHP